MQQEMYTRNVLYHVQSLQRIRFAFFQNHIDGFMKINKLLQEWAWWSGGWAPIFKEFGFECTEIRNPTVGRKTVMMKHTTR